ncbi:MAG TPA: PQQ-dependent sugar dehydrogenase [Pirellulales bacterium]|nr:PQQ-dependent sugar dehydrogenase [Pirellulales bacterium]
MGVALAGLLLFGGAVLAASPKPKLLVEGLKNPESVAVSAAGRVFISVIGGFDKNGDGAVVEIVDGKAKTIAQGLDDPKGLACWKDLLFVADKKRVWRIDAAGKATVFAAADAFPTPPLFLNDLTVDDQGKVYVSDSGDLKGGGGAVFSISPRGQLSLVTNAAKAKGLQGPNGLLVDDAEHLLLLDFVSGELHRVNLDDGKLQRMATGFAGGDGLARDPNGKIYLSEWTTGRVFVLGKESHSPTLLSDDFKAAADLCLSPDGKRLYVPDMTAGTLSVLELAGYPAVKLNEQPLPITAERAFANLDFARPIVLTHAGDGTNRVFVASQLGKVYAFANDQNVERAEEFFDLEDKVSYRDTQNEEGFLGMAFHPKFEDNRELFVYYSTTEKPLTSVISRFKANQDGTRVDPKTEEEILRIPQPFWNHNGGTIAFGPDGYLYIALGDGGKANDPFGNGQNLKTLLGSILRIDVDHKDEGKNYAVPKDNPFLDYPGAQGEIWAYGVRNIWRMSFDRQTGVCWAADVGQDIWEEIDLIVRGGNYGWNLREAKHPFGVGGLQAPRPDIVEPIFEYHHDVGKSITGGFVYRGQRLPELVGAYLYADYVTGKLYALQYDFDQREVTANQPIGGNILPVLSFGEDETGEVYFMTTQGFIQRLARAK